ncbi:phosphatidylglycerophosphatase A [Neptunomonas antarctica]|uniref:Phosphatidylglycerophosphatase A n=1 Tax=Neptunomonas antarctica TaxID=619304 RepID=A0A1N7J3X1_9GAMM|nr:phosphatidylglycerophosphatase A [Neptunomonas antarctica]SIS44014.1 phosphatidylglycerophosphatase [Neptunomonas antarctica]
MKPDAISILKNPIHCLAFGLGSGLAPKAPGTFGTLAAVPLFLLLSSLSLSEYLYVVVFTSVIGIYLCGKTARDLGVHDHPGIVWDEFVGFWITMIAIPVTWWSVLLGFALFRLFDIWKPWPIKWVDQHVDGGFGIMFDDVLAGLLALGCMHLFIQFMS